MLLTLRFVSLKSIELYIPTLQGEGNGEGGRERCREGGKQGGKMEGLFSGTAGVKQIVRRGKHMKVEPAEGRSEGC